MKKVIIFVITIVALCVITFNIFYIINAVNDISIIRRSWKQQSITIEDCNNNIKNNMLCGFLTLLVSGTVIIAIKNTKGS